MSRLSQAKQATKEQLKARVAIDGPSGAGKTWTSLEWATVLAQGGRILVIDTEHSSAALYADTFDFETIPWEPPYSPAELADTIRDASKEGYAAVVIDSLSHFWEGEGGTRDMVDAATEKAKGNSFAGWKVGTPALRHLIDTMLGCDLHLVATMRTKMEYILETDSRGRQVPKKVGMAPVMRAGVEYEFTAVGDMNLDHQLHFTKSRCSALADVLVQPHRAAEAAETFLAWLNSGDPAEPRVEMVPSHPAKAELLAALGGDRASAKALWDGAFGPDATEVPRLELDAVLANLPDDDGDDHDPGPAGPGEDPGPDGPGDQVADDPARDPDPLAADGDDPGSDDPRDASSPEAAEPAQATPEPERDPAAGEPASGGGAAASPAAAAPHRPLRPLQRKMHALAAQAWPDVESMNPAGNRSWRETRRKGLIKFLTGHDSSHDLSADELAEVCDCLEQVRDGHLEVVQRANGEWTAQARKAPTKKPAAKKAASGGKAA